MHGCGCVADSCVAMVLSGCGCVAVSCVVVVPCLSLAGGLSCGCFLGGCAFEWRCHFVTPVPCCLPGLSVACWVTGRVGLAVGTVVLHMVVMRVLSPVWTVLCVCLCALAAPPPVERYRTDMDPMQTQAHTHPQPAPAHSGLVSASAGC